MLLIKAHMLRLLYTDRPYFLDHLRLERSGELALLSLFVPCGGLSEGVSVCVLDGRVKGELTHSSVAGKEE
jgi:hypothetical protein